MIFASRSGRGSWWLVFWCAVVILACSAFYYWCTRPGTMTEFKDPSLTETDYYNCAAIVARAAEGGPSQCFAPSWKEYYGALMRFQDGYENTALGHDTIMYAWKERGKTLCALLAEHGQKPEFPAETPNCPPPHNQAPVIVDRFE